MSKTSMSAVDMPSLHADARKEGGDLASSPESVQDGVYCASYRVHTETLSVVCESADFFDHINLFLRKLESPEDGANYRFTVFRDRGNGSPSLQLVCPEMQVARVARDASDAWAIFRSLFLKLYLNHELPYYIMHGSSVSDGCGKTALILGSSDAGKTSTLIGLLQRGLSMVCDDYCAIGLDTGSLVSLPVGVTVTAASARMYPELKPLMSPGYRFVLQNEEQWTVNLTDLYSSCPAYSLHQPTHFFFLYPQFGHDSRIEELDREQALWWFHGGRFRALGATESFFSNNREFHEAGFDLARRMINQARFFKVTNGDIRKTVDLIEAAMS